MKKFTFTLGLILLSLSSFALDYKEIEQSRFVSWAIGDQPFSIENTKIYQSFKPKKEIVVAVIDTGIDFSHPFLKDNIWTKGKISDKNYGKDFSNSTVSSTPLDSHGHGTHVSGIIKSVNPFIKILPLKYYNPQATGEENLKATIKALEYAVNMNVDIINYSGGGPVASMEELALLKKAHKKGILIVVASGNERSNIDVLESAYYPASYKLPNMISVAAYDQNLNIIPSSNYGDKSVDIAAPGHRIRSAIPGGAAGYMTGTSQATAFVTGLASIIKSFNPNLSPVEIKSIIIESGTSLPNFENKIKRAKKINIANAFALASTYSYESNTRNLSSNDIIIPTADLKEEIDLPKTISNVTEESLIKEHKGSVEYKTTMGLLGFVSILLIAVVILMKNVKKDE